MLERFLRRLEDEVDKTLSPSEVEALIAETREHLNDSIQARLELGYAMDEAEREAVAAFGGARSVAQAVSRESARPGERARVRLLASAYGLFIVGLVAGPPFQRWSETLYHAIFVLGWLAVAAFAIASFRARRPAPVRIVATGLVAAAALWVAIGTTWLNFYPYGGFGMVPRWETGRYLDQVRRTQSEHLKGLDDADVFATQTRAVSTAIAHPLGNLLSLAPETLTVGTAAAAAGGAIDFVFGAFGALAFAARRRARKGPLGA